MGKVSEKIKEEFLAMIPPTIFFFFTLGLVAVVRHADDEGNRDPISTPIQVAVGALILGKAVLIADMLPIINRYPDKPLAYNVAWKTVIYVLAALVIHYLERLIDFWKEAGGFGGWQREVACGNGVAPLLGDSDHSGRADFRLLRDA